LSTDVTLSPVEKILLARAHKVAAWLKEGVTSLATSNPKSTLEDLATLGWETAARILWIRDNSSPLTASNTLRFRADAIKCGNCSSSASLINGSQNCNNCEENVTAETELTSSGPGSASGTTDRVVLLGAIQCACGGIPFNSLYCSSCGITPGHRHGYAYSYNQNQYQNIRIAVNTKEPLIEEMIGWEIKDYELAMTAA
jgi:hypothetical protein